MQFTFFWHGIFSQWYMRDMVIDGVTYNCCEQYMMAEKARLFGDNEMLAKIMKSSEPSEQKAYGRDVKGFDKSQWDSVADDIVMNGNYHKFTQHDDLEEALLKTVGTELVEASPVDKIWGIGLEAADPRAKDKSRWRGTNRLGIALDRVRDKILADKETSSGASEV